MIRLSFQLFRGLLAVFRSQILFSILTTFIVFTFAQAANKTMDNPESLETTAVYGNQDLEISKNELPKLEDDALRGSSDAAHRLSLFYDMVKMDSKEATYWAQIEAENGSPRGQYTYAFHLYKDSDPKKRIRARYWLELALKNGEPHAASLLKEMDEDDKH